MMGSDRSRIVSEDQIVEDCSLWSMWEGERAEQRESVHRGLRGERTERSESVEPFERGRKLSLELFCTFRTNRRFCEQASGRNYKL